MDINVQSVIYFVRHAQTDHNRSHLLQGHLDTHLDFFGRIQAQRCGKYLAEISGEEPFDAVFGSDLSRCQETAELILKETNKNARRRKRVFTEFSAGLRERDMGELDGLSVRQAQILCSASGRDFRSFGEPPRDAADRIKRQVLRIMATIRSRQLHRVLIVTHSSVILRALLYLDKAKMLVSTLPRDHEGNLKLEPSHNTGISQIWMLRNGPLVLQSHGDTHHLDASSLDVASGYNMDAQLEQYDKMGPS